MDIPIILTNNFLKHEFANLDYQPKEEWNLDFIPKKSKVDCF
jgi:hypothetical protein